MSDLQYEDYWFEYVLREDPDKIKNLIREEYIRSQELNIHLDIYDDETPREKTIIFIHGTSVYSRFYAEWLYNLYKQGFRIVAPDMSGHGKSEGTRGHFTMEKFSQEISDVVEYVINHYGEKIAVMGSSLGGITSLYATAFEPRIKAAVCHNAAIFDEKAYKKIVEMNLLLRILLPLVPIATKLAPKFRISTLLYLDFERLAKTQDVKNKIDYLLEDPLLSLKYTVTAIRTQMKDPLAKPIEEIKTPIMIINGDEDVLFSEEYMTEIYERLTCEQRKLEIIEDASHLIFQENIQESLKRVVPWLNKVLE